MSTIKANTLLHSDGSTTTQPSIPALDQRMAKAWVNFNGTGTVAIRDSYNVSSITDLGTGKYKTSFTTAMSNANYVMAGMSAYALLNNPYRTVHIWDRATTYLSLVITYGSSGVYDSEEISAIAFSN